MRWREEIKVRAICQRFSLARSTASRVKVVSENRAGKKGKFQSQFVKKLATRLSFTFTIRYTFIVPLRDVALSTLHLCMRAIRQFSLDFPLLPPQFVCCVSQTWNDFIIISTSTPPTSRNRIIIFATIQWECRFALESIYIHIFPPTSSSSCQARLVYVVSDDDWKLDSFTNNTNLRSSSIRERNEDVHEFET